MQYNKLVNTLLDAFTKEYPKRRFLLTKLLGSGAEGGAFLASASDWGNNPSQVVIKIQKNMKPNEKQFLSCLVEYQNLYENGNNQQYLPTYLIRIYEYFQWQKNHCIVMEVGQEDLYRFINNSRNVSIQEKVQICFQIIYPILFLHQQKLIHRDIKQENYIKVGNVFKLIDFGLIRSSLSDVKTLQVGSTIFQAPEIIENRSDYTDKVDIWSLGCVFYEILATQPLFDGQTHQEVTKNIKNHKTYPVPVNNKINQLQISQQFKTILTSMLIYDEKKRPSIQQVYDVFKSYLNPQQKVISQIIPKQDIPQPYEQQENNKQQQIKPQNTNPAIKSENNSSEQLNQIIQNKEPNLNQQQPNIDFKKIIQNNIEQIDTDIKSNKETNNLNQNQLKNEKFQDCLKNQAFQIPLHQDQYITQCNEVFEKLIKEGQQQIKDTLTNQKSLYESKINELKNEFQTQNKINQNKIDLQNSQITELIKQVENLNQQKKQLEQDQQNFKLEIERFKQKIKDEEVKFNTEKNQLNKEIKEFKEKINKMNQFSENLKKENENKNQELQKLFIKNQNNETLIQEIQDKLKESSTSLNKAKSLADIFQNQEKVQKIQIKTQDQQSIIQEITYSQEQKSENPCLNIQSTQEYKNLIENLKTELQKQINDVLLVQENRNKDQLNLIKEQHSSQIINLNNEIADQNNQLKNITQVSSIEKEQLNIEIVDLKNQIENIKQSSEKEKEQQNLRNSQMENSNQELKRQVEQLNESLNQQKSQFQELQQNSQKELNDLKSELVVCQQTSQAEKLRQSKEIDELNGKIQKYEEDNKIQNEKIKKYEEDNKIQNEKIKKHEEDNKIQNEKIKKYEEEIKILNEKIKELEEQNLNKNQELQKLNQENQQFKDNLNQAIQPQNQVNALIEFFKQNQNLDGYIENNSEKYMELVSLLSQNN
ncbi:unnamed protein product [Paramecium pentaurelia]|uniref:non-specific serine/threonine protein kinase n=1 Tax=Paramecium pentaurelia TaxID=43138 RepID=A0A8S1V4L9_9CILI|nr:unnamed protein product [Paramecium pentaurelia]